jgi:U32 family peptidase
MKNLSAHVDGFLIGNEQFGTRLTHSFSSDEISKAILLSKELNKELFLVCNQMFNDDQLSLFKTFLDQFDLNQITGFVVGDIGALRILSKRGFHSKVIYNPETLLTKVYDVNFLANEHILGVYLAKEITLNDIKTIASQKKLNLFMVGHGHLNMFYSKRQLIENFVTYNEEENIYHNQQNLKIIEENRKDEAYPILEDQAGTHVFRSKVLSTLNHLIELNDYIDYLVIDTLFKDDFYAEKILPLYKNQVINLEIVDSLKSTYHEKWDEGFFFTKTIYKSKG